MLYVMDNGGISPVSHFVKSTDFVQNITYAEKHGCVVKAYAHMRAVDDETVEIHSEGMTITALFNEPYPPLKPANDRT